MRPAVAGGLPRKVPYDSTSMVAGVQVPGGTDCSISAFTAQRDPDIFPDPEAFKPERWLTKDDELRKKMLKVYLVFVSPPPEDVLLTCTGRYRRRGQVRC